MVLEGVIVRSKLYEETSGISYFEVMKDEEVIQVRIPGGPSREIMEGQASSLEIGEKVDLYVFVRDWELQGRDGEKKSGSVLYVRGITHYSS